MKTRPGQRTLEALKKLGIKAGVVERFIPQRNIRIDLFNIIDIIALTDRGVLGIQACGTDWSPHIKKLAEKEEELRAWVTTPGTVFQVWGWRQLKLKPHHTRKRWVPRIQEFGIDDFGPMPLFSETNDPATAIGCKPLNAK